MKKDRGEVLYFPVLQFFLIKNVILNKKTAMLPRTYLSSDFGWWEITGSELGIRTIHLVENPETKNSETPSELSEAVQQMQEYFEGKRTHFDLKLDWSGAPDFHRQVWAELLKIPYGKTTTYLAIAEALGDKNSVRAVGQANRNNPIAVVVPCHRVIAKSGELQGYFYGLDMKRRLLELENPVKYARQGELF